MRLLTNRRQPVFLLLAAFIFCLVPRAVADLVWSPQTGWRVEGGALSGLASTEGRHALDLMNKAREKEENRSWGSAISSYNKVAAKYPNSLYAPEALYRAGKLRLQRREYFKAFDAFQQAIARYPNTKRFNEIIGEQYRIASALLDGARNRSWGWLPGFTNRTKAIQFFEVILTNAPFSDYAPLSLMNIARAHHKAGDIDEAIDALDRMINAYPQNLLTPDAYLKLALAHASLVEGPDYDQASTKEALTYFEDFVILFPGDPSVVVAEKGLGDMKTMLAESKIRIGDFYFNKRNNYTAARVFYNEAITVYPDSPVAGKARTRLTKVEAAAAGQKAKPAADSPKEPRKKKRFFFF